MFNPRDYIGMPATKAKSALQSLGYDVIEVENIADDRYAFDCKLVVRVDICDKTVTLVTAKFLINI